METHLDVLRARASVVELYIDNQPATVREVAELMSTIRRDLFTYVASIILRVDYHDVMAVERSYVKDGMFFRLHANKSGAWIAKPGDYTAGKT